MERETPRGTYGGSLNVKVETNRSIKSMTHKRCVANLLTKTIRESLFGPSREWLDANAAAWETDVAKLIQDLKKAGFTLTYEKP